MPYNAYNCSDETAKKLETFREKVGIEFKTEFMDFLADHLDDMLYGIEARSRRSDPQNQIRKTRSERPADPETGGSDFTKMLIGKFEKLESKLTVSVSTLVSQKLEEAMEEFRVTAEQFMREADKKYQDKVFIPHEIELGPKPAEQLLKIAPPFARWSISEYYDLPLKMRRRIAEYDPYGLGLDYDDAIAFPQLALPYLYDELMKQYEEDGTLQRIADLFDERRLHPEKHPNKINFHTKIIDIMSEHSSKAYNKMLEEQRLRNLYLTAYDWWSQQHIGLTDEQFEEIAGFTKPISFYMDAARRGVDPMDLEKEFQSKKKYWMMIREEEEKIIHEYNNDEKTGADVLDKFVRQFLDPDFGYENII